MKFLENRNSTMYNEIISKLDNCAELMIAVAFVRDSGVNLLINRLLDAITKGVKVTLIMSNNFGISDISAVRRLMDIGINIKVYTGANSFHLKTYIFMNSNKTDVIIGSSNISSSALKNGVEWNILLNSTDDISQPFINQILDEYSYLWNNKYSIKLDYSNIEKFEYQQNMSYVEQFEDNFNSIHYNIYKSMNYNQSVDYMQTRSIGKNWSFQLYKSQLEKRVAEFGEKFNIVLICENGSNNEIKFVIPYSYLKQEILPYANLHKEKKCYYYNISKDYTFNWVSLITMNGNDFLLKKK